MNVLLTLLLVVQILAALGMIGLILMQHGKGADAGAAFGGGGAGSASLFGASGGANFLSRTTAVLAGIFLACTLGLAYFGNLRQTPASSGSVLEAVPSAPAAPATPEQQIPGAGSAPAAAPATSAPAAPAPGAGEIPAK
ncbi:MAG: preprotein translocase subunit SecG [Hydrogenophaga sp.]|uniref:preprotein translocase subunit SecG n=1 Tax=Hydrogenophaga sp. TaxID=1904254 RepID=UPI001D6C140B|nr:preprotein translocase subunit SecG [Hydrogenophaga sp.]MBX3611033.1 preprotein translocase subunit SecG [Hydrogenophaga sp.]